MRILFMDDDPHRHALFRMRNIGRAIDHVHTAADAMRTLLEAPAPYDEVWLDHDLSEAASMGVYAEHEVTGYHVATFIAEELPHELRPRIVVVHSLNPGGGDRMHAALVAGGVHVRRQPFCY